jgi:hypothetical protein
MTHRNCVRTRRRETGEFDADRGRREAEICVPYGTRQGGSIHVAPRTRVRARASRLARGAAAFANDA